MLFFVIFALMQVGFGWVGGSCLKIVLICHNVMQKFLVINLPFRDFI